MTENPIKVFVSYSWSSQQHEEWVLGLAKQLRNSGIDLILDKWDLKEGHDAQSFMEKMVTDPSVAKVIIISDQRYAEKANERSGGVGTEAQIISPKLYAKTVQDRFVAIVTSHDDAGNPHLPAFYGSRIHIDMSTDDLFAANFEQLLRWIYDKPLHVKPPIGTRPAFLDSESVLTTLGNEVALTQSIEKLRSGSLLSAAYLEEYFDSVIDGLEEFRLPTDGDSTTFDDLVIESVNRMLPAKNAIARVVFAIAKFDQNGATTQQLLTFLEQLSDFQIRPIGTSRFRNWDWDNFSFFASEVFISCIAIFIKCRRFDLAAELFENQYLQRSEGSENLKNRSFTTFNRGLDSLSHRNQRLDLNRTSLKADMLKERTDGSGLIFQDIMQADFVCYLRSALDSLKAQNQSSYWAPNTLVYVGFSPGPQEIFARARSLKFFEKLKVMLGVENVSEVKSLQKGYTSGVIHAPKFAYDTLPVLEMMDAGELASKP